VKDLPPKISRKIKIAVALCLIFVVWIFLAPFLARRLIVEKPLNRADAILVLSGSSVYLERTQEAAALFKKGIAPKILLTDDGLKSGWNRKEQRNPFFAERAHWELVNQGVPEDAIEILPAVVKTTHDEAILLEKTAKERGFKSILLVTSAYHTRRALWTFEKVLRDNNNSIEIGIEPAPVGMQTLPPDYWWLAAGGWKFVAGEYLKTIYYWVYY
jgi:uncharacterized SAM-binding protein YcdF (DUF218 family)